MKHLNILGLAAVATAALMALVGAGTASATTLTGVGGAVLPAGTTIHAANIGTVTITTPFKNIECTQSAIEGKTSNETGTAIKISGGMTFGNCNCEVKLLKSGSFSVVFPSTISAIGHELTTTCSTIFGNVHCILTTDGSDIGNVTSGTTAGIDVESANLPRLSTNALCDEAANWDGTYKIDNPDTLIVVK